MATGWAGDGAVQDQIDATVKDAVERAKRLLPSGPGRRIASIVAPRFPRHGARRLPACDLCVACQEAEDKDAAFSGYNRRGSKDSQLR